MKSKKIRMNLSLSEEYQEKLKVLAKAEDTPVSRLVRRWIDENFEKEKKKIDKKYKKRFEGLDLLEE